VSDPNAGNGATGSLTPVGSITPKHIIDNIEMSANGELSAGTIPLPYACSTVLSFRQGVSLEDVIGSHGN
jgi:hypothetical protein